MLGTDVISQSQLYFCFNTNDGIYVKLIALLLEKRNPVYLCRVAKIIGRSLFLTVKLQISYNRMMGQNQNKKRFFDKAAESDIGDLNPELSHQHCLFLL